MGDCSCRSKNSMKKYEELINRPRHVSCRRAPMSREDRAAQFAPFAALTGFDGVIEETGRLTDPMAELTEGEIAMLDAQLRRLAEKIGERHQTVIEYFCPDARKKGGAYVRAAGVAKKIDLYSRELCMEDGTRIPIDRIFRICPVDDGEKMP